MRRSNLTIFLLLFFCFLFPIISLAQTEETKATSYEKAVILEFKEISHQITEDDPGFMPDVKKVISVQEIKLKILSGKFKNQEKIIANSTTVNPGDLEIKEGDKVIIFFRRI